MTARATEHRSELASERGAEREASLPATVAANQSIRPVIRHQAWWWVAEDGAPPVVPGFVHSEFNPLVAAVADRCLSEQYGEPPLDDGRRTGLVLVSRGGDRVSAEHVRQSVAAGRRLGPLFFFQSVPNSILGYLAGRWGLAGPVACISPAGSPMSDGVAEAAVLLSDGDADEVLLVIAEQGATSTDGVACAHALLLGRPAEPAARVQPTEGRTA